MPLAENFHSKSVLIENGQFRMNSGGPSEDIPTATFTSEEISTIRKCKNFLMTLIQLAQRNESSNPQTFHNIKEIIQQLIDDTLTVEDFATRLQSELEHSPQPYLVPFLRKSLPLLRRKMTIKRTQTSSTTHNDEPKSKKRKMSETENSNECPVCFESVSV